MSVFFYKLHSQKHNLINVKNGQLNLSVHIPQDGSRDDRKEETIQKGRESEDKACMCVLLFECFCVNLYSSEDQNALKRIENEGGLEFSYHYVWVYDIAGIMTELYC